MKRTWVCASILIVGMVACHANTETMPGGPTILDRQPGRFPRAKPDEPSVTVDPSHVGATVSRLVMGANMAVWYNITLSSLTPALVTAGIAATRWPGGTASDYYHWQTNSFGPGLCAGHPNANSTFNNFMSDIVGPAHLDVAVTVNYGSNATCTGGADPSEAADWVAYANGTKNYGIAWWTVGNEEYGKWQL